MKALLVCATIVLLGMNTWLAVNQRRLNEKILILESANRDLNAAMAQPGDSAFSCWKQS